MKALITLGEFINVLNARYMESSTKEKLINLAIRITEQELSFDTKATFDSMKNLEGFTKELNHQKLISIKKDIMSITQNNTAKHAKTILEKIVKELDTIKF